jgi:hypothetical protein
MSAVRQFARHRFGLLSAIFAVAGVAALISAEGLWAQSSGPDVYRIEEDWQLVVNDPDFDENGPQVTCTISPLDMNTAYCALDLNYHTQPDYVAGGLQIHTWDPLDPMEIANSTHTQIMQTSGETVTWTQTMTYNNDGTITFQVINGQSQTWGTFGGQNGMSGHLTLNTPSVLSNLNGYSSDVSLNNSGVSFASNLVDSLTLMAVRYFDKNGNLILEVNTPQAVHPQN